MLSFIQYGIVFKISVPLIRFVFWKFRDMQTLSPSFNTPASVVMMATSTAIFVPAPMSSSVLSTSASGEESQLRFLEGGADGPRFSVRILADIFPIRKRI